MENKIKIWAKNKEKKDGNCITLSEHTNHIIEVFEKLKEKIENKYLQEYIKIAIQLHDLGKVLPYFQIRLLGNKSYKPFDITNNIYHSLFSVLWLNQEKLKEELKSYNTNYDEDYLKFILSAVAYHHWKESFEDLLRFGGNSFEKLSQTLFGKEMIKQLSENLIAEVSEINGFNKEIIVFNKEMLEGLSNGISFAEYVIPPYQLYWLPKRIETTDQKKRDWILLSGFLMRCDHFASFCEEEEEFYPIEIEKADYNSIKEKIKKKIGIEEKNIWQFTDIERCKNETTILIAPTGSGKTEFSFLWSNGEKFFYTLPIRSAVEQIYERAKNIFDDEENERTGLLHSDADVYLIGNRDEANSIKLYDMARQLSYPVMISTGDQFFPYALRPPGYEKIYATFSYSRLVIDEVQAYDPKAAAIVVKFIEDIVRMGGKFLLMTATLPGYIKKEIDERLKRLGIEKIKELNRYEDEKQKYIELKKHKIELRLINNKKGVNNKPEFSLPDDLLNEIVEKSKENRVLVVVNTVKQAQDVYNKILEKNTKNVWLFHSRYTLNDKSKIKSEIEKEFSNPKPDNEKAGKILIATQVVEASLDLDADYLYTEIAPMDALVQRMGRVLRRYRDNYVHNGDINVKIIKFEEGYESGNGRVYNEELLGITYSLLSSIDFQTDRIDYELLKAEAQKKFEYNSKNNKFVLKAINEEDVGKHKKGKKKYAETQEKKSNGRFCLLSEYDKYQLVNMLFELINDNGAHKKKFRVTLDILDAGYMSDRKSEAQRIFREIISTSVIVYEERSNLKNDLIKFFENHRESKKQYTHFKKDIISKYVVNIPGVKDKIINFYNSVEYWIENETDFDQIQKDKLKKWLRGVYFLDAGYDNKFGIGRDVLAHVQDNCSFI